MTNLKKAIREKGISQTYIAKKIGVNKQTITNWVKGNTYPDIKQAKIISEILDRSIDEIFFDFKVKVNINTDELINKDKAS